MKRAILALAFSVLPLVSHALAETIPARFAGLWSNAKTEAFSGLSLAVAPDGRGFMLANLGRIQITWRYTAANETLEGTMLSDEAATKGQTLATIEAHYDANQDSLTITNYKGISEVASLKGQQFTHKAAQIPEDLKKLL
jgi:hypothetical protein